MPLDPNKLTRKTGEALGAAQALARELNHSQVTPEHLLAALVGQPESVVLPVLERIGVSAKTVRDRLDDALGRIPKVYGETAQQAQLSAEAYRCSRPPTPSAPPSATTTSPPSTCSSP